MDSGARITRTKNTEKFCANKAECVNYPYIKVNGVNGKAYTCKNNDCANYPGCVLARVKLSGLHCIL